MNFNIKNMILLVYLTMIVFGVYKIDSQDKELVHESRHYSRYLDE